MLWYGIVAVMVAMYVVLDGFDLGAGLLHRFVARTDAERTQVLAAIGPFWDGNEVWLLAGGGTLFFAFPQAYAAGFSGFYLPLMIVLWLLILRGLSIEVRHRGDGPLWRSFWDTILTVSSGALAVVLGAALGNVLRGVPIDENGWFSMGLFDFHGPGVLDRYTVLLGLFSLSVLAMHGAWFLTWKTTGDLQKRARRAGAVAGLAALLLLIALTVATGRVQPDLFSPLAHRPLALALTVVAFAGMGAQIWFATTRRDRETFIASCVTIVGMLATAAALQYPVLLPATTDPSRSITAQSAMAGANGLAAGMHWWPIGFVLAAAYWSFLFHRFRGKAAAEAHH